MQKRSRRAVGTVNFGMAVLARTADRLHLQRTASCPVTEGVALSAQPRPRQLQRVFIRRAMGIVAVQTVLAHRRVLEQERSAFLRMALVAIVVDRVLAQQRFGEAAMRVMTVRAGDLAFAQRHVRRTEHLRALVLVTLEAGVGLERRP